MSRVKCCKDCKKREIGCHKPCPEYAAEAILNILLEGERKKVNQLRDDSWSISERRVRKRAGNWRWKKKDKRLGQK